MKRPSRRSFLKLAAAGSAALMTSGAAPLARAARATAAARRKSAAAVDATASLPAAMRKEIANQKASTARTLKALREFKLPAGSPMAFVFRPLRPARKGKTR